MALMEMVSEARLEEMTLATTAGREDVEEFLKRLDEELPVMLRQVICTLGYPMIDTEEEREELTRQIMAGLALIIPPQYTIVWNLARPFVRQLVRQILDGAAEQGAPYYEGVTPMLLPFPVTV